METTAGPQQELRDLLGFAIARGREQVAHAEETGDALSLRAAIATLSCLDSMRDLLAESPQSIREVRRYLQRAAAPYQRHPDFRADWLL